MADNFTTRLPPALWHERWVLDQVRRIGWLAEPFGQSLLPEMMRNTLRECTTLAGAKAPVRWMPDIICARPPDVKLIDAKAGDRWRETNNHVLEKDALQAAVRWTDALLCDVWFFFSDGRAATAAHIARYRDLRDMPQFREWRTDAYLFPRAICRETIEPTPPMVPGWRPGDRCPWEQAGDD